MSGPPRQIKDELGLETLEWPPYSPDLNPIENVWAYLNSKLDKDGVTSRRDLEDKVKRIWSRLPKEYAVSLVNSMDKRCMDVIENKGFIIDY